MTNEVRFGKEAREALQRGLNLAANACKVTLGPKGRNVVIQQKDGSGKVTKDGVEVISAVDPKDMTENLGAKLIAGVSKKTAEEAGDGTTTAAVLAQALFNGGLEALEAGHSPGGLKAGIDFAVERASEHLKTLAKPVQSSEEIAQVGTVSANGDTSIGKMLADAMDRVGREGIITVEEGTGFETTIDVVEGMQIDQGFVSPLFITNKEKAHTELEHPLIYITERKLKYMRDVLPIMEMAAKEERPLLIIADSVEGEVLPNLLLNLSKGALKSCAILAPSVGEYRSRFLEDIATSTGGTVHREGANFPIENITKEHLGTARLVTVSGSATTIVEGGGTEEALKTRASEVRLALEKSKDQFEQEFNKRRLAKLVGGVAVIKVGGKTTLEIKERTMRVEDALFATRAAVEEGIVPGGGITYRQLSILQATYEGREELHPMDFKGFVMGVELVNQMLNAPLRQLITNADMSERDILQGLDQPSSLGFNFRTNRAEDLFEAGIIEPAKVVRCAIQNAASIASLLLTTEVLISYIPFESKQNLF